MPDEQDPRVRVWEAWSELFLDTELSDNHINYIAEILAESPYSIEELQHIVNAEVAPVCGWNLFCVAGVWAGFDVDWLTERCRRLHKARTFEPGKPKKKGFWAFLTQPGAFKIFDFTRMVSDDYHRILARLEDIRAQQSRSD